MITARLPAGDRPVPGLLKKRGLSPEIKTGLKSNRNKKQEEKSCRNKKRQE